ncbi:mercury resistance system periplasmic binding protein MerP [Ferrigenium sp. UT4]
MRQLFAILALIALTVPVFAATQSVTLGISGMTCSACPITVKKILNKTAGVINTEMNVEKREAKVTFDDGKTSAELLMRATANAGYPSVVRK